MNLLHELQAILTPAVGSVAPDAAKVTEYGSQLRTSGKPEFGDYQLSCAMALGAALQRKPVDVANDIKAAVPANDWIERISVAGPGHLNITLKTAKLAEVLQRLSADLRLGVLPSAQAKSFAIDYSGPNVAKPLHVGHLRSTIIGDSLVRLLRFLGHTVVGDNHLGDWGTQFGILLYGYKNHRDDAAYQTDPVRELARLYTEVRKLAKVVGDEDDAGGEIMQQCRAETAKLHAGDPENVALWNEFMPACLEMLRPIYERLDVQIDHALGESFYNPMLPAIVDDLLAKGIARTSQGAVVLPNAKGIVPATPDELEREDPPALIRKRDGAFTYTTTDLATIRYRVATWKPDAMLYVVDARQALHFKTLFANAKRWGNDAVEFHHLQFGSILGENKKPFQTREGGTVGLSELIDDAVRLAGEKYEASCTERRELGHEVPELSPTEKATIAEVVGIGAMKYADLSGNRVSDYVFSHEKMLATVGNTAAYMQYAYARCRNILRKGDVDEAKLRQSPPSLTLAVAEERVLALQLLRFSDALQEAAAKYEPHHIAGYLWDLSKAANKFYDACPVLTAPDDATKSERLLLVDLTGRTIQLALGLLGIKTVERM